MKKFLLAALLSMCCFAAFAVQTISGDYVIYKDNTFLEETHVGFLYYDANTYGAVLYTPSANRRVSVLFTVSTENGAMELIGENVLTKVAMGNKADVEAVNYLMQILPSLYSWRISAQGRRAKDDGAVFYGSQKVSSQNLGGNVEVKTASFVPLFGIEKILGDKNAVLLQLERIGRITTSEGDFFNFGLPFEVEKKALAALDKNAKSDVKKIGTLKVKLDSQWQALAENAYLLGDAALLTVSNFEKKADMSQEELVKFFVLSTNERVVLFDTVKITGNASRFTVTAFIYDTQTQAVNFDKKTVVLSGNNYTLASLTVAKADYLANRVYFDGLF